MNIETDRKIRDLVKGGKGNEVVLEREGGSFTFEIDVKSEGEEGWTAPKKTVKANNHMDVNETEIARNYFETLFEEHEGNLECAPCEPIFQRH